MNRQYLSVVFLLLSAWTAASHADETSARYYSISMNDKLMGHAVIKSDRVTRNGQELQRLTSETSLKLALLGKQRSIRLASETLLRPGATQPLRYQLEATTNDVVQHLECEIAGGVARTWSYRDGDGKGDPTVTKTPQPTLLLGDNNFAHWRLLAQAAAASVKDGAATLSVFLPSAGQIETFELLRGETKGEQVLGATRRCTMWRLKKGEVSILVDARTHELVRMELPAQKTTIRLADESVVKRAQEARATEVLARHFAQSNVAFDDSLKVDSLIAEIDVQVIGSGVANDVAVLTTSMQKFEGKKKGARITGTVAIRARNYDPKDSPPFADQPKDEELSALLRPSQYIESEHPSIVAQSTALTQGAKTRWEAVLRIAKWVNKEIRYTIADTPSARLALEKRQGDCGPHSTLSVAMLRAAGIPARLVGGLLYTPAMGGTFGQHAWVEVHMGKAGWVPLDPTSGEYDRLSAVHIKLFEGMGGVVPKTVKVVAFAPPNRKVAAAKPAKAKPLPWKLSQPYTFKYSQGEKEIGKETFQIAKIRRDGKDVLQMKSKMELKVGAVTIKSDATLVVAANARPVSYHRELDVAGQKTTIECTFKDGKVEEKVSGSKDLTREVKLPEGAYCFDNNLMGCFVLICSQLTYQPDKKVDIPTFHPSSLQLIPLTLTPKKPKSIKIGGKEIECYECDISPIKNTFWVSRDGRFVRAKQGGIVIELAGAK